MEKRGKSLSRSISSKLKKSKSKVKGFVSGQKKKFKNLGKKSGHSVVASASESEDVDVGQSEETSILSGSRARGSGKVGFRFRLMGILILLMFIASSAGIILIPVIHRLGENYLWNSFAGSVTVILAFLGMAASASTILALYLIMFKLGEVRNKTVEGWNSVIFTFVSAILASITLLIAVFQFHDVVEIFGEEFMELLQGYWMTPELKAGMDRIQMDFHCCGFYSYEDWGKVDGLGEYPPGFVPFSCCSIYSSRPCVHEKVPAAKELGNSQVPPEKQLSIYTDGCKLPMEDYFKTMLYWVILISSVLVVAQILLMVVLALSRKSSTSG